MKHASMLTEEQKDNATHMIKIYKGITPRPDAMIINDRMAKTLDKF